MARHIHRLTRTFTIVKRVVKRLHRARIRTKLFLAISLCINIALILQLIANIAVYPNTTLAGRPIAGKSPQQVSDLLDTLTDEPYHIRVQDRQYTYKYTDMGVIVDKNKTIGDVFAPNKRLFPINAFHLITSLVFSRNVQPTLVFTQQFHQFVDSTIFDFSDNPDNIIFNQTEKSLVYVENKEQYRFDEGLFRSLLTQRFGNTQTPFYPQLAKVENTQVAAVAGEGKKLQNVFLSPLTVYIDAGGTQKIFYLTEKEMRDITIATFSADQTSVSVDLNSATATKSINDHIHALGFKTHDNVASPKVLNDFRSVIAGRLSGSTVDAVSMTLDKGPNSIGDIASKYIEVDISQQKMYLFRNGSLYKTYRVSTGLDYPTPTGQFSILNKVGLGYSNIYNDWLPYWMGFAYSDKLHAYFGIHELPYTLTSDQKIQRPTNFIGAPNTGGCVALDVGAAKAVYQFADVGTPVVIYN